jgi:hypothetical protein
MLKRLRARRPSLAVVLAGAALFMALGGPGYAATGGSFILGQSNLTNDTSLLAGSTSGDQLDVANINTGTSAKALGLLGKSPDAPALYAANNGGGPALGLTVRSGKSPFTTNSAVKVANLNADQLDGLDQSAFLPTTGKAADADKLDGLDSRSFSQAGYGSTTIVSNRVVLAPNTAEGLLNLPGLGLLSVSCPTGTSNAVARFYNTSGSLLDFWTNMDGYTVGDFLAAGAFVPVASYAGGRQFGQSFGVGFGDAPGPRRATFVQLLLFQVGDNAYCGAQATATVWNT